MLKIPKQIYFDEATLTLYSQYAQQEGKSFAATVRETLAAHPPKLKQIKKTFILDFYGAGKRPGQKHFTIKEERTAFMNAFSRVEKEKKYVR